MALKKGYAPVAFDDLAWEEDLRRARGSAPRIARETRVRLEREGQEVASLMACDEDARDGTSLPGCVKVYLPPPAGPLSLVYRIGRNKQAAFTSTTSPSASAITHPAPAPKPSTSSPTAASTADACQTSPCNPANASPTTSTKPA
ncbi:MAG TPA: hypothetical protein VNM89_03010 [Solirubrobacterales bacterium]|nr:hypothetical protein [Solirubrobacterales bacterium]